METTVGQLLIDQALPEKYKGQNRGLDKKRIGQLFAQIAEEDPELYAETLHKVSDVGRSVAWRAGATISLKGLGRSAAKERVLAPVRQEIARIIRNTRLTPEERNKRLITAASAAGPELQQALLDEARDEGNPFYDQIVSGGRGNASSFSSLRGADLLVSDQHGDAVPVPILSSYSEGLSPGEYFAASFGQRKGQLDVKLAVADAGYLAKQVNNAAQRLVVTHERPTETRLPVGLPVPVSDRDSVGAVLARDAGPYKAGETLTQRMLDKLQDQKIDDILVHSPLTDISEDGGLSSWAAGRRTRRGLDEIGDNVGLPAAQALTERLSQGLLNCLVAGTQVLMGDFSTRAIEDVRVGDVVMGADLLGNMTPTSVTNVFDNGVLPCVRTSFRAGKTVVAELESTVNHKCLVTTEFTNHSEQALNHVPRKLPIGKVCRDLRAVRVQGFASDGGKHEPMAYLLGALLGDGCYTESVCGVHFSCADNVLLSNMGAYMAAFNLRFTHLSAYYYRLSQIEQVEHPRNEKGQMLPGTVMNPARLLLDRYDLGNKYAYEKTLPADVDTWDNESVAQLIAGLIDTDGTVFQRKTRGVSTLSFGFCSTSRPMLDKVRELLMFRFGIYTTQPTKLEPGRHSSRHAVHTLYSFHCTERVSVSRFVRHIKLKGVKAEKVARWSADVTNFGTRKVAAAAKRVSQELIGNKQCYDIEVAHEDHLFVLANGLVVSNSKHTSGVGSRVPKSGFEYINRLIQAPENFPEAGPLAEEDGEVTAVRPAAQGGHVVEVGERQYYLQDGIQPLVAVGDHVEPGDDLSDGTPHPSDLVRLRGMGEARRVYTELLRQTLADSGAAQNRRNIEAVVTGLLNWARVTNPDGIGDNIYDDVVPFNRLAYNYRPRTTSQQLKLSLSAGKYLEEPVLHYTPGTRITRRVLDDLKKWGIDDVIVDDQQPDFEPNMVRGVHSVYNDPDWRVRLGGFYTASSFKDSVHRGRSSDTQSTSYVPGLTRGVGFGDQLKDTGLYGQATGR